MPSRRRLLLAVCLLGCGPAAPAATDPATLRDADGDGVADEADLCPREPESAHAHDVDGCPDRAHEYEGPFAILDHVAFEVGTARLLGRHPEILDAVAATIAGNASVGVVEVRGHLAPGDGSELALARVGVVVDELAARGIDRRRLSPVDLGARCGPDEGAPAARVDFRFAVLDAEPVEFPDECARSTEPPAPTP